jgi:hypothetical protein
VNNPGIYSLGDFTISTAATVIGTPILDLDGMTSITAQFRFQWGGGGSSVIARLATSLDQGTTWTEISRVDFATASRNVNFGLLAGSKSIYSPVVLSSEGLVDGILGDRLQLTIEIVGTYTGSTVLSGRVSVR